MKKRCNLLLALAIAGTMGANAQVRIGGDVVPNPSAILDLNPDDQTTQGNSTLGLALPRVNLVTTTSAVPLAAHINGMTVFNMVTQNDVTPGIYYNDGNKWVRLSSGEIQLATGVNEGDILVWNTTINEWEAQPEKDAVIGNEVTNATDGSLVRSGTGTSVDPYTLAISESGVETKHLANGAVTTEKVANNAITTEKITDKAVTHEKLANNSVMSVNIADNSITNQKIVNKTITKDKLGDDVWLEITNEINDISFIESDGIIGNEVTNATDGSLIRSGAGTSASPYTLAVGLGGVETKHLKDGAVTTEKIINKAITKDKLGDDIWLEIASEINDISFVESDGIIGNEVTNATDGSLIRSGSGTSASPYTLAIALGGVENKHIKDGSITNNKIVNNTISKEKLGDDVWNQVKTEITNSSIVAEVDGIVGNEVIGAADASLTRSGSGTAISPYRLGVTLGGIETVHLKDGAVTTEKIVNNAITQNKIADNSITNQKIVNKTISKDKLGDDVWLEITNEINDISFVESDGIIGNEVTNATDGSLIRSGTGTSASPYTLAVGLGGVETKHLKDGAVTTEKIINNAITKEKLGNDVWTQITQTIKSEEMDGVIGNEVTNATDGSLVRSGSGTSASPYTLAVSAAGIETKHLKDGAVTAQKIANNTITTDKLADAPSNSILYTDASNKWTTFNRKVATGVFNVPNDSTLTRCALALPDFGAGLYGIHIVCDADLPMPEGELVPSLFRFITDIKPYGVAGTRDLYFDSLVNFSNGDSHTTTAWLYDCNPLELELYCRNSGTKAVNFRIVCTWLMPF